MAVQVGATAPDDLGVHVVTSGHALMAGHVLEDYQPTCHEQCRDAPIKVQMARIAQDKNPI